MIALKAFYSMIPKWLALALVAILLVTSGWCWTKMKYYQTEYKSVQADNVILKNNEVVLKASLATCQKSLLAEEENCKGQAAVTVDTQSYKKRVGKVCVKEDPNAKTSVVDAIKLSNDLSARMSASGSANH